MNSVSINLNSYYNKLINLHNYTQIDVGHFLQNCSNFTHFSIIHKLTWIVGTKLVIFEYFLIKHVLPRHIQSIVILATFFSLCIWNGLQSKSHNKLLSFSPFSWIALSSSKWFKSIFIPHFFPSPELLWVLAGPLLWDMDTTRVTLMPVQCNRH